MFTFLMRLLELYSNMTLPLRVAPKTSQRALRASLDHCQSLQPYPRRLQLTNFPSSPYCSVCYSWEELKHAIVAVGFVVEKEWRATCHYTLNDRSMMRTQYQAVFFQVRHLNRTRQKPPFSDAIRIRRSKGS